MSSPSPSAASAPWKQLLLTALDSNAHLNHARFFQLATVSSNGRPANRTVVFRPAISTPLACPPCLLLLLTLPYGLLLQGFLGSCDKIQINTDGRSNKIEDIKHCPFGEICWYFSDSWEQFRLNGRIDIIDGSNPDPLKHQEREKAWFGSSLRSRSQYLAPRPGLPCILDGPEIESNDLEPSTGPVSSFCLLVFDPEQVDYLNLKSNERLMFTSKQYTDGCKHWMSQEVNP